MGAFTPIFAIVIVLVLAAIGDRLLTGWMAARVTKRIFRDPERLPRGCRVALVLGCPPVRQDGRPNRYLMARLAAARALLETGCVGRLRLSGIGDEAGPDADEIEAMRRVLLDAGVSEDRLELDPGAARTIDSIRNAARDLPGERIVLVSQPFHLLRALVLADAAGLPVSLGFSAGELRPARGEPEALREGLARWRTLLDAARLRATR